MWSRIANPILAGLVLMSPTISAHAKVTGMTVEPKSPIVGHSVTAIATDDQKHEVVKWSWSCTLTDAGAGSPTAIKSTVPGRATFHVLCGGTYRVSLEVTYGGPMPPPPDTVSVALTVARPAALKIIDGLDVPVHYPGVAIATTIRSQVISQKADAGEHLLGMAQRRVLNRTWWDGRKDPEQPWEPEAPGPSFGQLGGVIDSWVILNIAPRDWERIPQGKPFVTWDEEVRLVYELGPTLRRDKVVTVECPLGTEHLSIVKVDDGHWAVRGSVKAGPSGDRSPQVAPPASKRSLRGAQGDAGTKVK
jgi:hypothetical protein